MRNPEMVVKYYDAIYRIKSGDTKPLLSYATQQKVDNIFMNEILASPHGFLKFQEQVSPHTHYSVGFYKPWKWYSAYKEAPDVLSYILDSYYDMEYSKTHSTSGNNSHRTHITLPFQQNNGNKFINLFDIHEIMMVREFTEFILEINLDIPSSLRKSLIYINALTGRPQYSIRLYREGGEDVVMVRDKPKVQDLFYAFMRSCYRDLPYSLQYTYSNALITSNVVYSHSPTDGWMKSIRMFINLLVEDCGYKSVFTADMTMKKLITNSKQYKKYMSLSDDYNVKTGSDIMLLFPVLSEYVLWISEATDSYIIDHALKTQYKRFMNSNMLPMTKDDREEFEKLNSMSNDDVIRMMKRIENMCKMFT